MLNAPEIDAHDKAYVYIGGLDLRKHTYSFHDPFVFLHSNADRL